LNDKGCMGDVTVTVAQGASVSGLRDTTIAFTEQECSFPVPFHTTVRKFDGQWELSSSSPSIDVEATVTTKATNCEIDITDSVTITVQKLTTSAMVSVDATHVNLDEQSADITTVRLDEVTVGFEQAYVKITPNPDEEGKSYAPGEAALITQALNEQLVPEINGFIVIRMPTKITLADVATPEKAREFIQDWFLNGHVDAGRSTYIYKQEKGEIFDNRKERFLN